MIDNETKISSEAQKRGATFIAKMTQTLLDDRCWSRRQAELQTGVGYSTIQQMSTGIPVKQKNLRDFAQAVGQDPDVWSVIAVANKPERFLSESDIQNLPEIVRGELIEAKARFQSGKQHKNSKIDTDDLWALGAVPSATNKTGKQI